METTIVFWGYISIKGDKAELLRHYIGIIYRQRKRKWKLLHDNKGYYVFGLAINAICFRV